MRRDGTVCAAGNLEALEAGSGLQPSCGADLMGEAECSASVVRNGTPRST